MAIVKVRVTVKDARLGASRATSERFSTTSAMAKRVGASRATIERFCPPRDMAERVDATRAMASQNSFDSPRANVERSGATRAMVKRVDTPRARVERFSSTRSRVESVNAPRANVETVDTSKAKRVGGTSARDDRIGVAKASDERVGASKVRYPRLGSFRVSDERVGAVRARDEIARAYKSRNVVSQFFVRQFQHGKATRGESFSSPHRILKDNYVEDKEDQNTSRHRVKKRQRLFDYYHPDKKVKCKHSDVSHHRPYQTSMQTDFATKSLVEVEQKDRSKVKGALLAYKEILSKSFARKSNWCYVRAAMVLKKEGKWVNTTKQVGSIPGVRVGDKFRYRAQLNIVGLHRQFTNGIDHMRRYDGKILATSIVDSGRYVNNLQSSDILIYSGQGGKSLFDKTKPTNQTMEGGNLALRNSKEEGTPIRVIRMLKHSKGCSCYVYHGLYTGEGILEATEHGVMIYKFRLRRMAGQPEILFDNS